MGVRLLPFKHSSFAASLYINWKFNLDCAAWFGGSWERLVASVKRCIKKEVGVRTTTYVELQTLVSEIELIMNNRPVDADPMLIMKTIWKKY